MDQIEKRLGAVLREAEFDPKLKSYWFVGGILFLLITFVGVVVIPVWLLVGAAYCERRFRSLKCVLTEKALIVKAGVLFKVEKTIPLDRVQDVTLTEGPLLKAFGLCSIHAETAGGGAQAGGGVGSPGAAQLTGIVKARGFRDAILDQRERIASGGRERGASGGAAEDVDVLAEIRDAVLRIEERMKNSG